VASVQSFTLWQQATTEITRQFTLVLLVHATYIWVLFFSHILFVVNHTFNAMPMERLQQ